MSLFTQNLISLALALDHICAVNQASQRSADADAMFDRSMRVAPHGKAWIRSNI